MAKIKKKSKAALASKYKYGTYSSNFWMSDDQWDFENRKDGRSAGKDLVMLASYQRAISNFVKIVTGEMIPVRFSTGNDSYTDGKHVTISSKLNESKFDVTVGLALHEGSHCKLTDFKVLHDLRTRVVNSTIGCLNTGVLEPWIEKYVNTIYKSSDTSQLEVFIQFAMKEIKTLINVIEDRRIDMYIYKNAPGYRGYYDAMYNEYFDSKWVSKALRSRQYRDSSNWDHWMFRIINMTNANRDLQALVGFRLVWDAIDLPRIGRLKNTDDVFEVALKVFWLLIDLTGTPPEEFLKGYPQPNQDGESDSSLNEFFDELVGDGGEGGGRPSDNMPDEYSDTTEGDYDLTDTEQSRADRDFDQQKDFVDGNVAKSKLSQKDAATVNNISDQPVDVKHANVNPTNWRGETIPGHVYRIPCTVIRECTPAIMNMDEFSSLFMSEYNAERDTRRSMTVESGIRFGQILGRKLKIRNEERELKFTRLETGKIDKRSIAGLGYGIENVFFRKDVSRYKPMYFHLSIDASGSMSGAPFEDSISLAIAIAVAAKAAGNIEVCIDIRGTYYAGMAPRPIVAIVYDSKRQSLNKLYSIARRLNSNSMTPEGLCFDAIHKVIIDNSKNTDAIFMNFSDGEPSFSAATEGGKNSVVSYHGEMAATHTASIMNKFRKHGIQVISYFISAYSSGRSHAQFQRMYGNDAEYISSKNIIDVTRTMNKRFLTMC